MKKETIENYLKTIYNLTSEEKKLVSNKQMAIALNLNPSTVTEGMKKLHELKYIIHEKSYGSRLTTDGAKLALEIVRRHRLWETFLAQELGFGWDEVHEIAEELEHIKNDKLIHKLANKLGNPKYDPHGDPIPDNEGRIQNNGFIRLSKVRVSGSYKMMGVTDHSKVFLKYLEKHALVIGVNIKVKTIENFDESYTLICQKKEINISYKAAHAIIVEEL